MSNYNQRENQGSIFKNDRKREGRNDPEYNGSANIEGREFWVSVWVKKPEGKKPFMSLSFEPKERRQDNPRTTTTPPQEEDDLQDIPF